MIVDTSALVALLASESDAAVFAEALHATDHARISAATYFELSIVIDCRGDAIASAQVDMLIEKTPIEIVPVTEAQARLAREAYRRFGKGRHPARLNYGDCFAYALARETGEPLLFKGGDFAETDVTPAI